MRKINLLALITLIYALNFTAGWAQSGPDPGENPNPELLQDEFLYELEGNTLKYWQVRGLSTILSGRNSYNSSTGNGIQIQATDAFSEFYQEINLTGKALQAGDVVEGQLHYYTDVESLPGESLRLAMQWINASGQVITEQSERSFIDNPTLFFSMPRTWSELRFRSTMPAGATKFRFAIKIAENATVRLDDFSLRKQDLPLTPFVSVLPQIRPALELEVGRSAVQTYRVMQSGLTRARTIELPEGVPFTLSRNEINTQDKVQELRITCTPTEAIKIPRGRASVSASINVDTSRDIRIPLRLFAIDPNNKPSMRIEPGTFETLVYEQGSTTAVTREIQLRFANMLDNVTISITPVGQGFTSSASSVSYFEKAYPSLGLNVGVNDTKIRISYRNAQATAGEVNAILTLSSPMADPVQYPIKVQVRSAQTGWEELFSREQTSNDTRYADLNEKGYIWLDKGLWRREGTAFVDSQDQNVTFYRGEDKFYYAGSFRNGGIYNEDFVNGIETIKVRADEFVGQDAQLAIEVSYDHGGTWHRPSPAQSVVAERELTFPIGTKQPTMFRLVRANAGSIDGGFSINRIQVIPAEASTRLVHESLIKIVDFASVQPQTSLRTLFNDGIHHAPLTTSSWRNISFSGNRPWVFFKQPASDSGTEEQEEVAKITLYNSTRQGDMPLTAHLISPLLSYTNATSKELTFRLYKQTETAGDRFMVYIAPIKTGKIDRLLQIPIEELSPNATLGERTWYDYLLKLDEYDLGDIQDFVVIFSLQSDYDGNETATTYLLDDFTWGQTDNPVIKLSRPFLAFFEQKAGIQSEALTATVTVTNPRDEVRLAMYASNNKVFTYTPSFLAPEGGEVQIKAKPERNIEYAGKLIFSTRGGANVELSVFSTPKTEMEILPVDAPSKANAYAYREGSELHIVAPELAKAVAYNTLGAELGRGETTDGKLTISLPTATAQAVLLHLTYQDGATQTIKL